MRSPSRLMVASLVVASVFGATVLAVSSTASPLDATGTVTMEGDLPSQHPSAAEGTYTAAHWDARSIAAASASPSSSSSSSPSSSPSPTCPTATPTPSPSPTTSALASSRSGTQSVVTHTVPVGAGPSAIAITPDGRTAVVANSASDTVSIIDVDGGTVTHTVTVGTQPIDIAVSPDGATAFVVVYGVFGDSSTSKLHWVDMATGIIICTLDAGVIGVYPTNVIVSPDGLFLYVYTTTVADWLAKVRVSDGSLVGSFYRLSIGSSITRAALSPDGQRLAISPNLGTSAIDIVDTSTMSLIQALPLSIAAGYVAFSSDGRSLFVTDRAQDEVYVIDTTTYATSRWPSGGQEPNSLIPASTGNVFVSNQTSGNLAQLFSGSVRSEVNVMGPQTPVLTESQDRVLVPSSSGNTLFIITTSNMQRELVQVGSSPVSVATARGYAVVSNSGSNTVSIIRLGDLPASGDQVPSAPLQQFGRIESHVCGADIPDSVLFPGVGQDQRADGWSMSWAEWPNGGTGGFVCTRQPYFTSTGQWSVG